MWRIVVSRNHKDLCFKKDFPTKVPGALTAFSRQSITKPECRRKCISLADHSGKSTIALS
jgi:hypothetical protein